MSDRCPTVRIVAPTDEGFAVINESDFDENQHVLFVEPYLNQASPEAEAALRDEQAASVDEVLDKVAKKKTKRG